MTPVACPVCGGTRTRGVSRPSDRAAGFVRCGDCRLLFQARLPVADGAGTVYSDGYFRLRQGGPDGTDGAVVREFRRRTFDHFLARLEQFARPGALLDAGCGEGYLLSAARDRGWGPLYGVDVAAPAVASAQRFARVHHGPLSSAPFPTASLDVVTFFDCLEHFPDPLAELRAASRLLKPGGLAWIVTPDANGVFARLMGAAWFQIKPDEHVRLYSRDALVRVLHAAGFADVRIARAGKFASLSFVSAILATTNPRLASALRAALARTPLWRRVFYLPSGDMRAIARSSRAPGGEMWRQAGPPAAVVNGSRTN